MEEVMPTEHNPEKFNPMTLQEDDQIYFAHIGKTGGRSFENFLKSKFPPDKVKRINVAQGYPKEIHPAVFRKFNLILGHLGYHFLTLAPENKRPFWVTMLRNPVELVISYYYFFRNTQPVTEGHTAYKYQEIASTGSLLEFVESEITASLVNNHQLHNLISTELLDYPLEHSKSWSSYSSDDLVALAKSRLENECLMFGITEHFDESIALLCHVFNWDVPTEPLTKLNVTPDKPSSENLKPEVIETIQDKVALDKEIYEFAKRLFLERFSAIS